MEETILDEYDQAVMIVRNFESLSPIARAMVVGYIKLNNIILIFCFNCGILTKGGLNEVRGENILDTGVEKGEGKTNTQKKGKFSFEWETNNSNGPYYKIENKQKKIEYTGKNKKEIIEFY